MKDDVAVKEKVTLADLDKHMTKTGGGKVVILPKFTEAQVDKEIERGVASRFLREVQGICTPSMAKHMLKYNRDNSAIVKSSIEQYAVNMAEKNWVLNAEPISFTWDGTLGSGQHRLLACIKAGVSFPTVLAFGIDPKMIMYRNSGKRDKGHNYLKSAGYKYPNELEKVIRWVLLYHESKGGSTARSSYAPTSYPNLAKTFDIESVYLAIKTAKDIERVSKKLVKPQYAAAVYYIARQFNKYDADKFFQEWAQGRPEPIAQKAQKVLAAMAAADNVNRSGQDWPKFVTLILAWNNWISPRVASKKEIGSWDVKTPVPFIAGDKSK